MPGLFIKKLQIQNYKCFEDETLELSTPDGTLGSGMNILIGENGNGKTSVLEALNYLSQTKYSIENGIYVGDFFNKDNEIKIKAETGDFKCKMPYPGNYFMSNGVELTVKCRERKSPGRFLSSPFQANNQFSSKTTNYFNSKDADSGNAIQPLHRIMDNEQIDSDEFNVFMFDKNRSRQISTGTYKTTFQRICEDLNWKFAKEITAATLAEMVKSLDGDYFKKVLDTAQKGTGTKLASELSTFFGSNEFSNLKIDLVDCLHPFTGAFFAVRDDAELKQIKSKALGSGIEIILTLLLLRAIAGQAKGTVIYLIDEPELHLHPKAQFKLVELLLEESKDKQILLSTHSPYIFKNALNGHSRMIIFKRDDTGKLGIEYPAVAGWGKFPWSPSWGEINYHAFDLPTVELHNELFGHIQETNSLATIADVDNHLHGAGVAQTRTWVRMSGGVPQPPQSVTLPTYVRHSIHHPENPHNAKYTDQDLRDSIAAMLPHA
jgi:predicted ATP-dependent endonuclease of OLD family